MFELHFCLLHLRISSLTHSLSHPLSHSSTTSLYQPPNTLLPPLCQPSNSHPRPTLYLPHATPSSSSSSSSSSSISSSSSSSSSISSISSSSSSSSSSSLRRAHGSVEETRGSCGLFQCYHRRQRQGHNFPQSTKRQGKTLTYSTLT